VGGQGWAADGYDFSHDRVRRHRPAAWKALRRGGPPRGRPPAARPPLLLVYAKPGRRQRITSACAANAGLGPGAAGIDAALLRQLEPPAGESAVEIRVWRTGAVHRPRLE
jgi:hypothetical protein